MNVDKAALLKQSAANGGANSVFGKVPSSRQMPAQSAAGIFIGGDKPVIHTNRQDLYLA